MTRVDVFSQIYLVFLALGTIVGSVVITYTLYKVYKYRAGNDHEYDVGRPQLGELPTGADKGGRKLFLSFTLSAIIVISLIAWTYGLLLYVETGGAEVPEDGVEVDVVGDNFAWEFAYTDSDTLPRDQLNDSVEMMGQQATAEALAEARSNDSLSYSAALAARMDEASNETVTESDVSTNYETVTRMRVPTGREIHIDTTSGDVWHNFGIPEFRVKSDAIPDETSETWFVADEAGEYRIACYELCGSGHSGMTGTVIAMSNEEYENWYEGQVIEIDAAIEALEAGTYGQSSATATADGSGNDAANASTSASAAGSAGGVGA
ncbi:cytochrome c oxidase subunit II [Salinarchaeum laminariae]|uniref:cytochrome c oxidase subunit II n=1 Tax=Salinarchaeum laminariae TaxID=869888 RepID=UPI0020C0581B